MAMEIRNWLTDLWIVGDGKVQGAYTQMLCYAYNWATSPTAIRTDREHRACQRLARYAMIRLRFRTGWHESDSGRLWPSGGVVRK